MSMILPELQGTCAIIEEPTSCLLIPYLPDVYLLLSPVMIMTSFKLENVFHVELLAKNVGNWGTTLTNPKAEEACIFLHEMKSLFVVILYSKNRIECL